MITGYLVICSEKQVFAEQATIHPEQRNSLFPHLTHCLKNFFGFLHYAYLHFSLKLKFLTPFALWLAFPTALGGRCPTDYYGVSVAIGLAPRRRSRSTVMNDVIRGFRVSFRGLIGLIDPCSREEDFTLS